jgi:hypothetical protein
LRGAIFPVRVGNGINRFSDSLVSRGRGRGNNTIPAGRLKMSATDCGYQPPERYVAGARVLDPTK